MKFNVLFFEEKPMFYPFFSEIWCPKCFWMNSMFYMLLSEIRCFWEKSIFEWNLIYIFVRNSVFYSFQSESCCLIKFESNSTFHLVFERNSISNSWYWVIISFIHSRVKFDVLFIHQWKFNVFRFWVKADIFSFREKFKLLFNFF